MSPVIDLAARRSAAELRQQLSRIELSPFELAAIKVTAGYRVLADASAKWRDVPPTLAEVIDAEDITRQLVDTLLQIKASAQVSSPGGDDAA